MKKDFDSEKQQKGYPEKTGKNILRMICGVIVLCAAGYVGIAFYYMDGFSFGTWINGVYCTGKSVEEVNEELLSRTEDAKLEVIYPVSGGMELPETKRHKSSFTFDEAMAKQDYTKPLQQLFMEQRPLLWYRNLLASGGSYQLSPSVILSEEGKRKFQEQFLADREVRAERERKAVITVMPDAEEGFILYDGKKSRLDTEKALAECIAAIEKGKESITLSESCYYSERPSAAEKKQEELYESLKAFLDFTIVYDMGAEQVKLDKKALLDMLAGEEEGGFAGYITDEKGDFVWEKEKIEQAVDRLADTYDTYGKAREFTTTDGNTITLKKGTYGTKLDRKAEKEWLIKALAERKNQTHIPAYEREAWARGKNDIGDTYIEINITKQKLWFYQNGELEIETPVVTGNMMRHRETPDGVYYIYSKQKNRILRGPGYASHVNYWMPVKGGVGIHDALWRDEFGGDIYKKEGSHGCINTPFEAMEKLYEAAETGMPVVIYYEEEGEK